MALKDLKSGTAVKLSKLSNEEHKTTPPARFSEVKLVAELESRNIGRPSTYSSIVSLIQDRGYVRKRGTQLYPTALGFAVARLLAAKFPTFTAYDYTALMEDELDSIADGKQRRDKFLAKFWNGTSGFEALLKKLTDSIDFTEIEKFSTIDLHNGYSVRFSKFGTFIQDTNGKRSEKGYLPSVRIDDDTDIWEYKDPAVCKEAFENSANKVDNRELGVLKTGVYAGWFAEAKDGRFGPYIQAVHPDYAKAMEAGKKPGPSVPKPVNQKLPEGAAISAVDLKAVEGLFAEIKLPRNLSDNFFVGIGKRGPWLGYKVNAKAKRAVFVGLPEGADPRTITLAEVEAVWAEKQAKKDTKKAPKK